MNDEQRLRVYRNIVKRVLAEQRKVTLMRVVAAFLAGAGLASWYFGRE